MGELERLRLGCPSSALAAGRAGGRRAHGSAAGRADVRRARRSAAGRADVRRARRSAAGQAEVQRALGRAAERFERWSARRNVAWRINALGKSPGKSLGKSGGKSLGKSGGMSLGKSGGMAGARGQAGLTLLEMMVALAVAAVLLGLAVPGFAAFRRSADVSSAANELVWALHLARSSAVLRGQPVTVCLSRDERTCLQSPQTAADGWLVFQPAGQALAFPAAPSGPVLHSFRLPETVAVQGTRPAVTFWPLSRAGTTGTFEICDLEGRTAGRSIVVSQTGRPRVAAEAPSCAG